MTDKHYYEKRRNTPRLPIVYTTADILQKLDYLAGVHGSKKAAIEIEKILSLLQAEGINPYDEEMVVKSLSETVMPMANVEVYKEWLNNRNKEQAKSW